MSGLGLPPRKFRNLPQYLRYVATGLQREADFIEGEKMQFESSKELFEVLDPYIQQLMIASDSMVAEPVDPEAYKVLNAIGKGNKIQAIKNLREIFREKGAESSKLGLKDAKDEVERVAEFHYDSDDSKSYGRLLVGEWKFRGKRFV